MQDKKRDGWDKADIILKPVGGLLTALAVGALGFFGSRALDRRQAEDNKVRLYTELMSKREDSESGFRKEMFNSIFGTFLTPTRTRYEQQLINLELLSYNFNEDVDLSPIFKLLYSQITESREPRADEYIRRLMNAADEVKSRQIATLEGAGAKLDASINIGELEKTPQGISVINGKLSLRPRGANESGPILKTADFRLEALYVDLKHQQIRVKLEVRTPESNGGPEVPTVYSVFWISPFDFPMMTNTRLPQGQRCAIVLRKFGNSSAQITLIYFPDGWRAARVVDMAHFLTTETVQ